jgi:hypothetical protein
MTKQQAIEAHEAAKARYSVLTSAAVRDEAEIAKALATHRTTRYNLEKFQQAGMAEGFRWNR